MPQPPYEMFDESILATPWRFHSELLVAPLQRMDARMRQLFTFAPLNDAGVAECLLSAYEPWLRRADKKWAVWLNGRWKHVSFETMMRIAQLTLYLRVVVLNQEGDLPRETEQLLIDWAHERRRLMAIVRAVEEQLDAKSTSNRIPKSLRFQRDRRRKDDE